MQSLLLRLVVCCKVILFLGYGGLVTPVVADAAGDVPQTTMVEAPTDSTEQVLAESLARLVESVIPTEYKRRKDWGTRKNLTTGLKINDSGISRRKRPVKHGTWKQYEFEIPDPEENLSVRVANLRPVSGNQMGVTLVMNATLDTKARAKIYKYGIHMISLQIVADATVELTIDCTVGIEFTLHEGKPAIKVTPQVTDAELDIQKLRVRRISSADGPLVKELGDEIKRAIEKELQGDVLVKRLNRSIEKKRDRLMIKL